MRVTVVDLRMNERRGDGLSSGIVKSVPDSEGHEWIENMI